MDQHFKGILLLPLVAADDGDVWDTLVAVLPVYFQKRLEIQRRSLRQDFSLEGSGADATRQAVALMRHMLHIMSALLGLVNRCVCVGGGGD